MNFKEFETPEKLRGGYYTPMSPAEHVGSIIAQAMAGVESAEA